MRRGLWLSLGVLAVMAAGLALWLATRADEPVATAPSGDGALILPSGLEASLQEMIWNQPGEGLTYRFRFLAPAFHDTSDLEQVMEDLEFLCRSFALPKLANTGPLPGRVVISLADKPSEFGTFDPDVVQVFEAFSVSDGACIWEAF